MPKKNAVKINVEALIILDVLEILISLKESDFLS
jgi:hypothetical protein